MRGMLQAGGADARGKAEIRVVRHRQGLLVILDADHARDRAEHFLAAEAHLVRAFREERGLEIEAGILAVQPLAAPMQLRAFRAAERDIALVDFELFRVDHRADMRAGLECIIHHERLHPFGECRDEAVVDALGHDQARGGRAALTGGEERAIRGAFHGNPEIGIVEHDKRILAAHFELHLLHRRGGDAGSCDAPPGADRARKRDRQNIAVIDDRLAHHRALAHDKVQHAPGQPRAMENVAERPGRMRHEFRRLDHHRVAIGERRRELPRGNGNREVPWRDHADDTQSLPRDFDAHAGADGIHDLAIEAQGLASEEGKDLPGPGGLANALGERLAFLAAQNAPQFVLARHHLVGGALEDVMPLLRIAARPGGKGGFRGGNRVVHISGAAARKLADHVMGVRGVDVRQHPCGADALASDEVRELRGHGHSSRAVRGLALGSCWIVLAFGAIPPVPWRGLAPLGFAPDVAIDLVCELLDGWRSKFERRSSAFSAFTGGRISSRVFRVFRLEWLREVQERLEAGASTRQAGAAARFPELRGRWPKPVSGASLPGKPQSVRPALGAPSRRTIGLSCLLPMPAMLKMAIRLSGAVACLFWVRPEPSGAQRSRPSWSAVMRWCASSGLVPELAEPCRRRMSRAFCPARPCASET